MRSSANKHWLIDQLEKNLFPILVGGALIYTSFHNADTMTAQQIKDMNAKLEKLDAIYERVCRLETKAQVGQCK